MNYCSRRCSCYAVIPSVRSEEIQNCPLRILPGLPNGRRLVSLQFIIFLGNLQFSFRSTCAPHSTSSSQLFSYFLSINVFPSADACHQFSPKQRLNCFFSTFTFCLGNKHSPHIIRADADTTWCRKNNYPSVQPQENSDQACYVEPGEEVEIFVMS